MKFVFALFLAVPLFAQDCYVLSPPSFSIGADTYLGTVHVSPATGRDCGNYNVTTPTLWLHITSAVGGAPGTDVTFTADANLTANARSGVLLISSQNVVVTQAGANCAYGITPATQSFPVEGGTGTANIQAACTWQIASTAKWIAFTGITQGLAAGSVAYAVAANTCVDARTGSITLQTSLANPPALAVTQAGAPGNLTLSPASVTAPAAAGNGRIAVNTGDTCSWTAIADASWIQITVGASGTGNGGISYALAANTSTQPRYGYIHVGALTCAITQQPPAPAVVLKSVANAANYNTDAVSPGEILALFGDNLGPSSIATPDVSGGSYPKTLAGTQVLFDGAPAPMIYSLKSQVSAVAPYSLAGKTSTQVQVQYQNGVSNTMTMPVRAATPAIFSLDASGIGPGAILNQDLSVNSTGNPADRLSIIVLFTTGGGVTDPPSTDGEVVGLPLRKLLVDPVVTIGGVNAAVKFAGPAPYLVAGMTQINVEVPAGVTPGIALPVIVKIGDSSSTGAVTVAVK